ncbi:hypothetical protein [Streptomyces sp. CS090A]|uniref:hypothetical protein n=1 Tax=Streptomyces sp. CS090A TaxID=2162710 RepID=UPI0013A548C0|nr:hypothetical protein [Streptomyces sp. CS090A]
MSGNPNTNSTPLNWWNRVTCWSRHKMFIWWNRFNRLCRRNSPGLTVVIGVMAIAVAIAVA